VFDKTQSFLDGIARCRAFLSLNSLREPAFINAPDGKLFGWYTSNKVWVNVGKTRPATITPGFSWTYPGYKADLTAYGVTAHEVGHHVQAIRKISRHEIRVITALEPRVTSYEPTPNESFAEMMKVFITNPDLLRVGRPVRWIFLTRQLGLRPVDDRPWTDVLSAAHPKFIAAAHNWIKQGRSELPKL
jgi:hypothetical protein